jgi:hypothetical protein
MDWLATDKQQTHGGSAALHPNFAPFHCAKLRHASTVRRNRPGQEKTIAPAEDKEGKTRIMKRRKFIGCCCGAIVCNAIAKIGNDKTSEKESKMSPMHISACGLNCNECDLFKLPTDKSIQDKMIPYFRKQTWLKEDEGIETIIEKGMYCKGCSVDKKAFWSDGCKIAICCKDEKELNNCSECAEFTCAILKEHENKGGKYRTGIEHLRTIRKDK